MLLRIENERQYAWICYPLGAILFSIIDQIATMFTSLRLKRTKNFIGYHQKPFKTQDLVEGV